MSDLTDDGCMARDAPAQGMLKGKGGMRHWRWAMPSLLLGALTLLVRYGGSSAWDLGDGALHYLQAKWAPWHPYLFFDRWAKPAYVLLGTAFAQAGPLGMVAFDALLAAATAVAILSVLGRGDKWLAWLVPIMLFFSIQYFKVVVSGLTEPLFGLATVLCVLLLWKGRSKASMALLSFTPFMRPEYVAFIPVLVLWVALHRQWRALPWLALGPVLYMVAGRIMLGNRLWYFAKDPYQGSTAYPAGPWDNFVSQAPLILGEPLLACAGLCILLLAVLARKDESHRKEHRDMLLLAALPVAGIWAAHSYAYWAGGHASAGLLRVLATATPLTVLFVAYTLFHAARRWLKHRATWALGLFTLGYLAWAQDDLRFRLHLPAEASAEQRMVEAVAEEARGRLRPGKRIAVLHPYSALLLGIDFWQEGEEGTGTVDLETLEIGDLIEWNAEYSGARSNLAEELLADDRFALVAMHGEGAGWGHPPWAIWLFERTSQVQEHALDTLEDLQGRPDEWKARWRDPFPCPEGPGAVLCGNESEFPLALAGLLPATGYQGALVEWTLEYELEAESGSDGTGLTAVCSVDAGKGEGHGFYEEEGLSPGRNAVTFRLGGALYGQPAEIKLWNRGQRPYRIRDLKLIRKCWARTG